jgi:hypothetical protein
MAQKMMEEPLLAKTGAAIETIDRWIFNGLGFPPGRFITFLCVSDRKQSTAAAR